MKNRLIYLRERLPEKQFFAMTKVGGNAYFMI